MAGPDKIMLIRHAEKPEDSTPAGVREDGTANKHSIIVRGWQRAGALVAFFAKPSHPKIATPNAIFAAATTDDPAVKPEDAKSLRPQETATPLAARLGLRVNTSVPVGQETTLISALQQTPGIVLVTWEHKRIPTIAAAFGRVPDSWGEAFDVVWVLDRLSDGSYAFSVVNQDLLAGDSAG